jgi:hypothetical protein
MKNINKFLIAVGSIIVIAIIVLVFTLILDTTGRINQGNFRINDFVIKSSVEVTDSEIAKDNKLSDMSLNLSQSNLLSILIAKSDNAEIASMYIDNISTNFPSKKGNLVISQNLQEKNSEYDLSSKMDKIAITPTEKDSQYYIELNIKNKDMLKNIKLPESVKSITYDGTILNTMEINIKDISFTVSFDLNVLDKYGKLNKCKFSIKLPTESLIKDGISIERQDLSKFNFIVK